MCFTFSWFAKRSQTIIQLLKTIIINQYRSSIFSYQYAKQTGYLSQSTQINLAKSNNISNLQQIWTIKTTSSNRLRDA